MKNTLVLALGALLIAQTGWCFTTLEAGSIFSDPLNETLSGPTMVVIPAGSFQMGEDTLGFSGPKHTITFVRPFAIGRTPVSKAQFLTFFESTQYKTDAEKNVGDEPGCLSKHLNGISWKQPGFVQSDAEPVVCISWNDAKAYTEWLSKVTNRRYRLPSESEWEYAARAGSESKFVFGDDGARVCEYANVEDKTAAGQFGSKWFANSCDDGALYTSPVGNYKPNAFGLFDMLGNVLEWMEDCGYYDYEKANPHGNPNEDKDCTDRSIRGGSWLSSASELEVRRRFRSKSFARTFVHGFRVASDLSEAAIQIKNVGRENR